MNEDDKKFNRCVKYSMYTILYLNDTVCNHIRFLEPYIKDKDKETKKLFHALENRAYNYFRMIHKIIGEGNDWFFSDYCSVIDEKIDELVEEYTNEIKEAYSNSGINEKDSDFFSRVETFRSISDLSIIAGKRLVEKTEEISSRCSALKRYLLEDINNIAQKFANRVYRNVEQTVNLNENSNVLEKLNKVYTEIINYKNFEDAYIKAENYEKCRRKHIQNK